MGTFTLAAFAHNFGIVYSFALALWLLVYFGAEKIRRHKSCKKACGAQKALFAPSAFKNQTFPSALPLGIQGIYDWDGDRISQTLAEHYIKQGCEYEIVQEEDESMSDMRRLHPLIPTPHFSIVPIQQPINQGVCKLV